MVILIHEVNQNQITLFHHTIGTLENWYLSALLPAPLQNYNLINSGICFRSNKSGELRGKSTNKIDQFWENNTTINKTKIYLVMVPTCHCLKQSRSLIDVMFVELLWKSKASCQNQWLWSTTASNPIPATFSFIFWTDHCNINIQRSWLSRYATNLFVFDNDLAFIRHYGFSPINFC